MERDEDGTLDSEAELVADSMPPEGDFEIEADNEIVIEVVSVNDGVMHKVVVEDGVMDRDPLSVSDRELDAISFVLDADTSNDGVTEGDKDAVSSGEGVGVSVMVCEGLERVPADKLTKGVPVRTTLAVMEGVMVGGLPDFDIVCSYERVALDDTSCDQDNAEGDTELVLEFRLNFVTVAANIVVDCVREGAVMLRIWVGIE